MIANAGRCDQAPTRWSCEIDGQEYRQGPFAYQGKCLAWLREQYAALGSADRAAVDALLAGTGCEPLLL